MKKMKKWAVVTAVLLVVAMFAGCGEVAKTEFQAPNETFSIQMDETWNTETMQDNILAIFNKNDTKCIIVVQFVKSLGYTDVAQAKDEVESIFTMNNVTAAKAPASIPGLDNLSADTSGIVLEGQSEQCYTVYGESEYAYYSFIYIAKSVSDKMIEQFQTVCSSFVETAPEIENNSQVAVTDTIRWFNATNGILLSANGGDSNLFAGFPANEDTMAREVEVLERDWGVTDRASADETLDWVLTEGHRMDYVSQMEGFEADAEGITDVAEADRTAWLCDNFYVTESEAENYMYWYNPFAQKGEAAISAWDYSRAMSLCGFYYQAGYYTETEALDKSLEIAQTIQSTYGSWDEFMESYFLGYEWWAEQDSAERRAIYDELKAADNSMYSLDFGMPLEKTW